MYTYIRVFKKTRLISYTLMVFLMGTFLIDDALGSGKEVIVINGTQVYSFYKSEFDLTRTTASKENAVHYVVDEYPVFKLPYGLKKYVESLMSYPEEAIRNHVEGVVLVNFVVERDGNLSNIRILRGIGFGCDDEVLAVFTDFPSAMPGKIGGNPVRVGMTLPVRFKLKN